MILQCVDVMSGFNVGITDGRDRRSISLRYQVV
jgi:hypothetical protein